jgi:hypothetical protein
MRSCAQRTVHRDGRGGVVIETHRAQRSFGDGLIAAEVADLHKAWMRRADRVLDDPQIVRSSPAASAEPQARLTGRPGRPRWCCVCWCSSTCANWSYAVLEREVRANLV